jgi:integrase/recombinase XerD
MPTSTVGSVLYTFFEDYLKCQKGLSTASIRSYRDGLRLFLQFVAQDTKRAMSRLTLADCSAERVRRFLNTLETARANHRRFSRTESHSQKRTCSGRSSWYSKALL